MAERATTEPTIVHDAAGSRYEIWVDGELSGYAGYQLGDGTITFTHTVTMPPKRGRGLAAMVVRRALDDARAADQRVVAQCWYVAQFIDEHREYADLLDR
jgi:uncharacterized protein